ncbi:MAG TPA: SprT family zinc-dependent metalloprotease [Methanoregulaceae archaeon]|nr:SprT family zinc-dependent metalloprotease [Methanoregulaceae archaeon]
MGIFSIPAYNKSGFSLEDSVRFGDSKISYGITYSRKRKTLAIVLHRPGYIEVKAPAGFSLSSVRKVVLRKSPWILKKLAGFADSTPRAVTRVYSSGELFHYLGNEISLNIIHDGDGGPETGPFNGNTGGGPGRRVPGATDPPVTLCGTTLAVFVPGTVSRQTTRDYVKKHVVAWYRTHSALYIGDRIRYFSSLLGIPSPEFRVRNIRKRWGSCSHDNHLSFNIRLIMAPENQIDYVVLHEMCHISHKDHQPQFWSEVGRHMPDYKQRKDLLKREGWQYVL